MGFLDNSGDIILDAVLTDTGRLRLAQGDGSFKISKFALGDDEINYGLYNKTHASGSAYYDLEVMQTPILEAFTNNTSNMKTKLVSVSRTNILFMPILKLNENDLGVNGQTTTARQTGASKTYERSSIHTDKFDNISDNKFYVAVDQDTLTALESGRNAAGSSKSATADNGTLCGLIKGFASNVARTDHIRVDQGLDASEIPPELGLDSDLLETAYIVELDYRLARVKPVTLDTPEPVNFIDDDNIASYYLTKNTFVNPHGSLDNVPNHTKNGSQSIEDLEGVSNMVFAGPRGSTLQFRLQASQELQSSTYLFTQIGQSQPASTSGNILGLETDDSLTSTGTIYYIDSTVRVTGANTGFRLDIPIRFVKVVY